jgi:aldehyde dehydrogenase (NAD+)
MIRKTDFYIDGAWVAPVTANDLAVINPADETAFATISLGSSADVDRAVAAARAAFAGWSQTSRDERLAKLESLATIYERRSDEMAKAISQEMGAPITLATRAQARAGLGHIKACCASSSSSTRCATMPRMSTSCTSRSGYAA